MDPAVTEATLDSVACENTLAAEQCVAFATEDISEAEPLGFPFFRRLVIGGPNAHIFPEEGCWELEGRISPAARVFVQHIVEVDVVQ